MRITKCLVAIDYYNPSIRVGFFSHLQHFIYLELGVVHDIHVDK